jgi:hypothetical protein
VLDRFVPLGMVSGLDLADQLVLLSCIYLYFVGRIVKLFQFSCLLVVTFFKVTGKSRLELMLVIVLHCPMRKLELSSLAVC